MHTKCARVQWKQQKWVSNVDQYNRSVSVISSSSPQSVVEEGGYMKKLESTGKQRAKSDVGRKIQMPAVHYRDVFTINLKHTKLGQTLSDQGWIYLLAVADFALCVMISHPRAVLLRGAFDGDRGQSDKDSCWHRRTHIQTQRQIWHEIRSMRSYECKAWFWV